MSPPTSTHQSALRIIKPKGRPPFIGKYVKSEIQKWKNEFLEKLRAYKNIYKIEKGKPVHLAIILSYLPPKSRPIKDGKVRPKVTKPDADNVSKTIIDSLVEAGLFETDEQIFSLRITKVEWESEFIHVAYTEVDNNQWCLTKLD
jgi:Holliday junction resolvase RusA-like endonuclease